VFRWNIRNQIMGSGVVSLLVMLGVIAYFYGLSKSELQANSENLIRMTNAKYAEQLETLMADQANSFSEWTADDLFGIALEFGTTDELTSQFESWMLHSSDFLAIALVDEKGYVVQASASARLRSAASTLRGRHLPELNDVTAISEAEARLVNSETLGRMGAPESRSYMFYQPSFNMSGIRNGAFVAFSDWTAVDRITELCARDLAGLGYENMRSLLVDPGTGEILSRSGAGSEIGSELQIRIASWSDNADIGAVQTVDLGTAPMCVGVSNVVPPLVNGQDAAGTAMPHLLSVVPHGEITAKLNSELVNVLAIGLLGTLIVLGFTFSVARRISKRINFVADFASGMATGDIDRTIDTHSGDEIGVLARAFNDLSDYLREMAQAAERIAGNDLTVRIEPRSDKDVLGHSFKAMVVKLSAMVLRITSSAEQLVAAASSIATAAREIQGGVDNQAGQLTQVSTAIEEMAVTVIESARNASEAKNASRDAAETANQGGSVVGNAILKMEKITNVVRDSAQSIADLAKSADQIGEIARVIDDIADQTNLLALNAAIEAARAGEQGRGFAVVADEVRKLAERTGTATAEIATMIKEVQRQTENAVNSMEAGVQEVDTGRELVDKAGDSLTNIVAVSERVMGMIQQIATASEEQSVAAEEISKNVENISTVTEATSRGAEQFSQAAAELNEQSADLNAVVNEFRIEEKTEQS